MAGGQGAEAGKLEALAATHKQNQAALVKAGFNNTFAAYIPTHTHVSRPSTDEEKIAELIRLGTINSKNLWVVCGATVFNSEVVMNAVSTAAIGFWAWAMLPPIADLLFFLLKTFTLIFIFVWMRGTLPRARIDQLMGFAWKWLLPASLLNLFATAAAVLLTS